VIAVLEDTWDDDFRGGVAALRALGARVVSAEAAGQEAIRALETESRKRHPSLL
jgi:hypothetical protein